MIRFLVSRAVHPLHLQICDVVAVDLRQRAVTLARIAARIRQPILRFVVSVQKTVVRHLGKQGAGNEDKWEENTILHEPSPGARADYSPTTDIHSNLFGFSLRPRVSYSEAVRGSGYFVFPLIGAALPNKSAR
jgi:hypothetical protein